MKLFTPQGNRISNPEPGTVVNSEITKEGNPEFYLVSQKVIQGTAVPTHYTICYNDTSFPMIDIHELTYKLCYTYFNVSGSIRVPCLVQYATRFASLITELSKSSKSKKSFSAVVPHKHLEDNLQSLYYI